MQYTFCSEWLKQGDVFLSLLFSFALEYTIKKVQEIEGWDWMEDSSVWSLMIINYVETSTIKENTKTLLQ
jgi:hypothetical protein